MKVIAFFNVKGGVGKTTTAVNVAYNLAAEGKRVLLADLDPQSNSSDFYDREGNTEFTMCHVLSDGNIPPNEVVSKTSFKNLDIIPAHLSLGRAEKLLMSDTTVPQQFRLKRYLVKLWDNYDYCILDCSPSPENLVNINGLAVADAVFVPLKCDKWAMCGLENTLKVVETVGTYNDRLRFGGAFFVQWENRRVNNSVFESLKKDLGVKLLSEKIRKSKLVEESTYERIPLSVPKTKGQPSRVAADYLELTKRLVTIVG